MTAAQLRDILAVLLAPVLGTYTTSNGTGVELPAIRLGQPPRHYLARGLECRVRVVPEVQQLPAHGRGALLESHSVRLVQHGGREEDLHAAVRRISGRWPDVQFREIPANEELGILAQHVVTIPA